MAGQSMLSQPIMPSVFTLNLIACVALVPACLIVLRAPLRTDAPRGALWGGLGLAVVGTGVSAIWRQSGAGWDASLAAALWTSIAATLLLFLPLAAMSRMTGRLAPLLLPYMLALGISASLAGLAPPQIKILEGGVWLGVHVGLSVATYALLTLAAIAGLAVFLRERALRRGQAAGRLVAGLPALAEGTRLMHALLRATLGVLLIGELSGMAAGWVEGRGMLHLDHKTLLSLITFVAVGGLLFAHRRGGIGGRRLAHGVVCAYLLLSLAYPGVKFVTDFLLG